MKIAKKMWFKRYSKCVVRPIDPKQDFDLNPAQTHVAVCTPVKHKWRRCYALPPIVTRAAVIRAFSTPNRPRAAVLAIVAKYIGDNTVPPAWSRLGIRGTFGKEIERLWARHIHPLRVATYRDSESGHRLTPVVQTLYDFGATQVKMRELEAALRAMPAASPPFLILDEALRITL